MSDLTLKIFQFAAIVLGVFAIDDLLDNDNNFQMQDGNGVLVVLSSLSYTVYLCATANLYLTTCFRVLQQQPFLDRHTYINGALFATSIFAYNALTAIHNSMSIGDHSDNADNGQRQLQIVAPMVSDATKEANEVAQVIVAIIYVANAVYVPFMWYYHRPIEVEAPRTVTMRR